MRLSFLSKFALLSLASIVLVGLLLGWGIDKYTQENIVQQAISSASLLSRDPLDHHFTPEDFAKGLTPQRYQEIDELLRKHVINDQLILIKIWDREGKIIYSTNKKLVNRKFSLSEGLKRAFRNEILAEISSLEEVEHSEERKKFSRLIEIYTPIHSISSGKVIGSYELYFSAASLWKHVAQAKRLLWLTLLGGFSLLYLAVFGIARNTSRALVEKKDLEKLAIHLRRSLNELEATYVGTIQTLSAAVDVKDHYTAGHSLRVAYFAKVLGELAGLSEDKLKCLEQAALFHDIGKIGIPDIILNKEGPLTSEEFEVVKEHPGRGAEIIQSIPFLKDRVPIVRFHHENFDGTGYPEGLRGEETPLEARILKIADAYDALTSQRPYRPAKTPEEATATLKENRGEQFDPHLVDLFVEWLQERNFRPLEMLEVSSS